MGDDLPAGLTVPQLIALAFDRVVVGAQAALVDAGFDDLRPPHLLNVFRFLTIDGARPVDLARQAGITPQSMGELIVYLERAGYVRRVPDPDDGRSRVVHYADRGIAAALLAERYFADLESEWAQLAGRASIDRTRTTLRRVLT